LEEVLNSTKPGPPPTPPLLLATKAPLKKLPVYPAFHWFPPDLSEGSKLYNDHVRTLIYADTVLPDVLKILRIHRGNYTKTHPLIGDVLDIPQLESLTGTRFFYVAPVLH
jgi:hypothetical protein